MRMVPAALAALLPKKLEHWRETKWLSRGVLAVPGRLCAIFRCNLAIVAALRAIFRSDPTVDDGPFAAVGCLSAPRCGPDTFVGGALAVGGRPIPCASVEIAGSVIARLGRDITQLGGDVTVPRRQPGLAAAHCCQLVGPGVLAVPGRLGAVFSRHPAIVDGSFAAFRRPRTPRRGSSSLSHRNAGMRKNRNSGSTSEKRRGP